MREREWKRRRIQKRSRSPGLLLGVPAKAYKLLWCSLHTYGGGNTYKPTYRAKARERERQLVTAVRQGDEARYERLDPRWSRGEAIWDIW